MWIFFNESIPDSKAHGANMGHIWGRQDPGGPYVAPMNFAIWDLYFDSSSTEACYLGSNWY